MTTTAIKKETGMKATVELEPLCRSLDLAGKIAKRRSPAPVLQCVLLEATDGGLFLTANNMEQAMRIEVGASSPTSGGSCCVPCEVLAQVAKSCDGTSVTLEADDRRLDLRSERHAFGINGFDVDDFTSADDWRGDLVSVSPESFTRAVRLASGAVCRDPLRQGITGVYVELRNDGEYMVAGTDGRALVIHGDLSLKADVNCIIPLTACDMLSAIEETESLVIGIDQYRMFARWDGGWLSTCLVHGKFPPFRDLMPKGKAATQAVVQTSELLASVGSASIMTHEESRGIAFSFNGNESLSLTSMALEKGNAEIECPLESYEGEPIRIGLTLEVLATAVRGVGSDVVQIEMSAPNKPVKIVAQDGGGIGLAMTINL